MKGFSLNVSELFIRRPVMTTLLMLALLFYGIFAYVRLPVNDLPNVDFPTILVTASVPGASPETMASSVASPLEKQFTTIDGIDSMSSVSTLGQTSITLQFELDRDVDSAAVDVQAAISAANRALPKEMPTPPTFRKLNPAAAPILYIALSSDSISLTTLNLYAETLLAQRISMVTGVAKVNIFGSQKYAVRVQVNPGKLFYNGIGLDQLAQIIANNNTEQATGQLDSQSQSFLIRADAQLDNAKEFRDLPIKYNNPGILKLGDVATVLDSIENDKVASWHNGNRAIVLAIERQPGANTVAVIDKIRGILPEFQKQLPSGSKLAIVYDRSISIRDSIYGVQHALVLAAILVVIIIFLFLRNFYATLIPAIALPLSIIGTFAFMYLFDFSLNNVSLLALMLSVGYVIDDAIVMLENIFRYHEKGESSFEAALKGSRQVSFTIISITLSLVAVFIPVLFMGGLLGKLLFEFGVTITVAILLSGLISLTLTPMMASRLVSKEAHEDHYKWQRVIEGYYQTLAKCYQTTLRLALKHHVITFIVFLSTFALTFTVFIYVPKGFLPNEDTGRLFAFTEADSQVSFKTMVERQTAIQNVILANPNVDSLISVVGAGGASVGSNAGRFFMRLKPINERSQSADEIAQAMREEAKNIPGIIAYIQNIPSIRIGGLSKSQYQFTVQSTSLNELYEWATILTEKMRNLPGFQDVTSDLQFTGPQVDVTLNREKMAALGISGMVLEDTLGYAYSSRPISTIYKAEDSYDVLMELEPEFRTNPDRLGQLRIRSDDNALVQLNEVADISLGKGLLSVNHYGQFPAVTISFNLEPGYALSHAVSEIEKLRTKLNAPDTLITSFQGTAQVFKESITGLGLLFIVAIVTMYIVLGILYESFIQPLTILSGLPAATFGALATLMLFGVDLNIYSFIGLIMLIGIVKKNAIMMVDFALEAERNNNTPSTQAIYQACLLRFRPIMMTTLSALVGILPIVFGTGAGSEIRRPLGVSVFGGLLFSQVLTLYITPVIYLYLEKLRGREVDFNAFESKSEE